MSATDYPLPVTLITGFLGAGKTTLVNHLLRSTERRRIGVLVNDFGDVCIDQSLIVAKSEDVLSLANGCICCSLRNDLTSQLMALAEDPGRPEHLLIEASGVSDPRTLLEALLELQRYQAIRLDGVICVIDASEHLRLEGSPAALARRQLLAADCIVVAKSDLVTQRELSRLLSRLSDLTPAKPLVARSPTHGDIPPELLLGLEGPPERALEADGGRGLRIEPLEERLLSDWTTWRLSTSTPIVFKALVPILQELPEGIYRAKGFVHLLERPGDRLVLHLAGRRIQIRTIGRFSEPQPTSELVLIGTPEAVDGERLSERFEACLEGQADPGEAPPRVVGWMRG